VGNAQKKNLDDSTENDPGEDTSWSIQMASSESDAIVW
jgi:hypothetical protein